MINAITESETIIVILLVSAFWVIGHFYIRRLDIARDKKFELTIRNIAAISVILVIYNIFISERSNRRIEKNRLAFNTLENIQRNWLAPQKELAESYPEGYFLYTSMTPDADFGHLTPLQFDPVKRKQLEVYSSLRIFQAMEDFLTIGSYDLTGKYVWVNNFLMWMQSPILRQYWHELSFNYSSDTRQLVERLMVKGDELIKLRMTTGRLSVTDYDNISKTFYVKFR